MHKKNIDNMNYCQVFSQKNIYLLKIIEYKHELVLKKPVLTVVFLGGNFQLWQEQCKQHIHKNKHSIIWVFFLIWHKTKWPHGRQHPCDVSQDGDPTLEWLHMWWSTRVISCRFFLSVSTLEWLHMWWCTRVLSCRFFISPYLGVATHVVMYSCTEL